MVNESGNVHESNEPVGSDRHADRITGIPTSDGAGTGTGTTSGATSGGARHRRNRTGNTGTETKKPDTTLSLETKEVESPAKKPATRTRAKKEPVARIDASESARGLIEMVELFTRAKFGSDGEFNLTERALIEPALTRLLERYAPAMEQFSVLTDPLLLLGGLGMFAVRLRGVIKDQAPQKPDQPGQPADVDPGIPVVQPEAEPVIPVVDSSIADLLGGHFMS